MTKFDKGFIARRDFLRTGAGFLTALGASNAVAAKAVQPTLPDSMLYPSRPDEDYGLPSAHEKIVKRLVKKQTT